jgi:SAM-dependent methyltransferase
MSGGLYIHGTGRREQERLVLLNSLVNEPFLAFLAPRDGERVLDAGCGLGILAAEVARRVPRGQVVGLERAPEQLARARERPGQPPNLRLVGGDAHALPFEDGSFDLVCCRFVLEHLADPGRALSEMRRVLRPGGRLAVMENDSALHRPDPPLPAFQRVWGRFLELQRRLGGDGEIGRRLHALLRQAGFREIALDQQPEVHWAGQPTFRAWLDNAIGNVESGRAALVERGLGAREEIDAAVRELEAFKRDPDAAWWFAWNRARAAW